MKSHVFALPAVVSALVALPMFGQQTADQTIGNLSLRGSINVQSQLITGFVIAGTANTEVLIRGAGPALAPYGVSNPIRSPLLTLFDARGEKVAENAGWGSRPAAELFTIGRRGGRFAFEENSNDCGMVVTLAPGLYTVQLSGVAGSSGIGLIELYQGNGLGAVPQSSPHFINVSNRCVVGAGESVAIAGARLPRNRRLLIRAIGPSLAQFGVQQALANPKLEIVRPEFVSVLIGGVSIVPAVVAARNDEWNTQLPLPMGFDTTTFTLRPLAGVSWSGSDAEIRAATAKCGAFPLPEGSNDAAMLVTIDQSPLTINVSSSDGGSGVALIEIYDVEGL